MARPAHIILAKILRKGLRLSGGHGSALPGRIIEQLDPHFLARTLAPLPEGVVVVTGTNGKTTTTHMLVHLLRAQGKRVLTNPSGSNLTRGLISTIVEHSSTSGNLPFDIAVFEVDEAYAPLLARKVPLRLLLALNVMRDQLDRYGELDATATYIAKAAELAKTVVVNGNDVLLTAKTNAHQGRLLFGLASHLLAQLSSEDNLYAKAQRSAKPQKLDAEIVDFSTTETHAMYTLNSGGEQVSGSLPVLGLHNALNACAAIFTTKILIPPANLKECASELRNFQPAFGRGETLRIEGKDLTVALIKNPSGFTQNLSTFVRPGVGAVLIVINDEYADGRDVSWLWDVQIDKLKNFKGKIFVGGCRRFDMALRLKYAAVPFEVVDTDESDEMMRVILASSQWKEHLLIIPTYTAMLAIRKWLGVKLGRKHLW